MKTKKIGLTLILLGLALFLSPLTQGIVMEWGQKSRLQGYRSQTNPSDEKLTRRLLEDAKNYNDRVDESANAIVDPFSAKGYTTANPLESLDPEEPFAMIVIPKLEEELPVYLGATKGNLTKGAAQIEGTSLPVGGIDTRTVIAAHRGWRGVSYFRNIDALEPGDEIYIDLLGERLEYRVTDQVVIDPADNEKLAVEQGKDTLTLLTCHPYRVGTHRLLVNATRELKEPVLEEEPVETETRPVPEVQESKGSIFEIFSAFSPQRQRVLLLVGAGWLLFLWLAFRWVRLISGRKK